MFIIPALYLSDANVFFLSIVTVTLAVQKESGIQGEPALSNNPANNFCNVCNEWINMTS